MLHTVLTAHRRVAGLCRADALVIILIYNNTNRFIMIPLMKQFIVFFDICFSGKFSFFKCHCSCTLSAAIGDKKYI